MIKHLALAAVAVGLMASSSTASIVIDNFGPTTNIGLGSLGPVDAALTGDVDGDRIVSANGAASISIGGDDFEIISITDTGGPQATVTYDFTGTVDLHSTGTGLSGSPLVLDAFGEVEGTWTLVATFFSGASSISAAPIAITTAGVVAIDGTTLGDGALMSNVDQIQLAFTANSLEFNGIINRARLFRSGGSIAAVPEPTSIALLGLTGIGGVVAVRRRRKSVSNS